mmetsp:Transcript_3115/g.8940  ORF Transcript_3115/g.8940 Transcript_3115/m.8940 type:complete len:204 (+) Transcript_3115:380-991(+)
MLLGEIQHETSQLIMSVIRGTKTVDSAALKLAGVICDSSNGLGYIHCPDRLRQGFSTIDEWNKAKGLGHIRIIMEELVFSSEQLCWADNGGPWINLLDCLFSLELGTRPLRGVIRASVGRRYMDQIVHLHLHAQLGNLLGDSHIHIFKGIVLLKAHVGEFVNLNGLVTLVRFRDEVDNDVGICDNLLHRVYILGAVENKASMP